MPLYDIIRRQRARITQLPVEIRLWRKIVIGEPDECWLWLGSVDRGGYGQINDGLGHIVKTHRLVLGAKVGRTLKSSEWALHTCDVPPCCNPAHLYVGTVKENVRDMHERGRYRHQGAPGASNTNAKLDDGDVRAILAVLASHPPRGAQAQLARQYGVSPSIIMRIKQGVIWRHVTSP